MTAVIKLALVNGSTGKYKRNESLCLSCDVRWDQINTETLLIYQPPKLTFRVLL